MRRFLPLLLLAPLLLVGCDAFGGEDELVIDDLVVGTGDEATASSTVTLAYEGRLEDGTVFDSSEGVTFRLDQTIEGFQEGVSGMRVGGERRITIPPDLGYGSAGRPPVIPPNATLIFEVTLLDVVE